MENTENVNNAPNIDITKDSYVQLLNFASSLKMEERNEAMDIYRKVAQEMSDGEMIAVLGKTAILYLDLASKNSSSVIDIANSIQKIAFNDLDDEGSGSSTVTQEDREILASLAKGTREERRRRRIEEEERENGGEE